MGSIPISSTNSSNKLGAQRWIMNPVQEMLTMIPTSAAVISDRLRAFRASSMPARDVDLAITIVLRLEAPRVCLGLPQASHDTGLEDDDDAFSARRCLDAVRDRQLLPWYAIIVVNMFLVGILFGFLPVYVHSLGYNQLRNGLIVASATTSYLLVQPVAGMLADRFDPLKVMRAGLVLSSLGVLLVPFTAGLTTLVAACVVGGLGVGTVWTNSGAMVSQLAKPGRTASALGIGRLVQGTRGYAGPAPDRRSHSNVRIEDQLRDLRPHRPFVHPLPCGRRTSFEVGK